VIARRWPALARDLRRRAGAVVALAMLALVAAAPSRAAQVEVEAVLDRHAISIGDAATLQVTVRGAPMGVDQPEFDLPAGLEILSSGRANNFTWINGQSSVEIIFRYEITANAAGHYGIGPITVRVGKEAFRSGVLQLDATAAPSRIGGGAGGAAGAPGAAEGTSDANAPATLMVDVSPLNPWVGQPCVMRVRLVQRAPLAEDPQYTPPATPGFWTDRTSAPESYFADERGRRVLVTETRARLYPLAPGVSTVGEAVASLALASGAGDPMAWLTGRVPRREMVVRSTPVPVRVRALPPGAPQGFSGAVGDFTLRWSADRPRTSVDVPVTMRLDVRGRGNLPLIRPPELGAPDIEVFASTVDDSLASPGGDGIGRKRFQWTVLARTTGRHPIAAPAFAWFDPQAGAYRSADLAAIPIEVGPALFTGAGSSELPAVLSSHGVDAGARGPAPWAWALGGLLIGAALVLWRSSGDARVAAAQRAVPLEWLRAVGRASGPDFWRAADDASAWLGGRGRDVTHIRREIASARYGGTGIDAERVRRELVEAISQSLPPRSATAARRAIAVLVALAGLALIVVFGPRGADPRLDARARAADRTARAGDLESARRQWASLWSEGVHAPGLAARLAWAEAQGGAIGPAAAWVVRGQLAGPRDPGLAWVADRVREGGGLVGDTSQRLPVRALEWAIAALVLGAAAGLLWPRRSWAIALALLAVLAGAADPVQMMLGASERRAVVRETVALEGTGLDLQPGQVVRVLDRERDRARVSAGAGVAGWVPARSLDVVSGAS
jgi:hypothetical protein